MRPAVLLALTLLALTAAPSPAADPTFPLKDGDVWVMAGDSITAQHLHSNYFEAFCYARYPKLKFAFRNSGVGGHTIPSTLARFDYDIAAWKPTVVSVELGMNDSGGTATDKFIANMGTMTERIRKAGARPVIFAPSPVNDGTLMAKAQGRSVRLSEYSKALAVFSEKEKLPYADQFHALVDVWGKNKLIERVGDIKVLATDDNLAGVEHLRAFLAAQEKNPVKGVSLLGDPVHPGAPGQLMMAAALLKGLGAEGFVSSVTIDASTLAVSQDSAVDAKGCTVTAEALSNGVAFERLDHVLPFPIADGARPVLAIAPEVLALSQYTLTVKRLVLGEYQLKIGGAVVGRFSARQLSEGINLTALPPTGAKDANPITVQMRAILKAVDDKEAIVGQWRSLSQKAHAKGADKKLMDELAELTKKVEAADEKIRAAAKPQKLKFEVVRVDSK